MTPYDALGGEAAVVELAVLTTLRVAEAPLPDSWRTGAPHLLLDDERLAAYWTRALGGPADGTDTGPHAGPHYLLSPTEHDAGLADWVLGECLAQAAVETVVPESPRLRAVLAAFLAWDLAEAVDHVLGAPTLPERTEPPTWGWDGPQDRGSLARQDVLLDRLRAVVRTLRRHGDPSLSCRLRWVTQRTFDPWAPGGPRGMDTTLLLTVETDGDDACDWQVPRPPVPDENDLDDLWHQMTDWISTGTRFGWGREYPDPEGSG